MAMSEPFAKVLETTALDPVARANPYPRLKEQQEKCPVLHDPAIGSFWLTRYQDVRAIVNDRSLWRHPSRAEASSIVQLALPPPEGIADAYREGQSILMIDDPDHARIRTPLAKALYARVSKMKERVDGIVGEVLDRVQGRKRFDLMAEVALPIPILVIARILGVDESRLAEFREWSEAAILSVVPIGSEDEARRMVWGMNALADYFAELMRARDAEPRDDLVSDMMKLRRDGAAITEAELIVNLSGLLIGGNLTTTDLIGNGMWLLLTHPEELDKLRRDPSLVGPAVEEMLRYESPVDVTGRIASDDREFSGCPVKSRQSLLVSLRAANRDPSVFAEPDRFDITRRHAPHVAFGGGAHICIGAPLARMEAQAAVGGLVARFPDLKLAEQTLEWRTLPFFRGLQRLIVEV
jgi:cytochrome P450